MSSSSSDSDVVVKPPACSASLIRPSSMSARDRPRLPPTYQPESSASAGELAKTASAVTASSAEAFANLMSFMCFAPECLTPHGPGTLMTVLTRVTELTRDKALPSSVTTATLPGVENEAPDWAMMVPTMVPPPDGLIVAELPTCQKTFLAWAGAIRMTLYGTAAAPTVSVVAIWNTHTALASPWGSRVRSEP